MRTRELPIDSVVFDPDIYPRVFRDADWITVARYCDAMRSGCEFPAILVIPDPNNSSNFLLIDGYHRWRSKKRLKAETITAYVDENLAKQPRDEWFRKAAELNRDSKRALTSQDHAYVAKRLQDSGFSLKIIAETLGTIKSRIDTLLATRIVEAGDGSFTAVKSTFGPLVGSRKEGQIEGLQKPLAAMNVYAALDQAISVLRAGLVRMADPLAEKRVLELMVLLEELTTKTRKVA